ncbi:MAG: hypothetical protein ACXW2E_01120 [Nitrososphaeraceae archaeon]
MLINEILTEMSLEKIEVMRQIINHKFKNTGIIPKFSSHFLDRCTDGNIDKDGNIRGDDINFHDMMIVIDKFIKSYLPIIKRKQKMQNVIKNDETGLNILFQLWENNKGVKFITFITVIKLHDNAFKGFQKPYMV